MVTRVGDRIILDNLQMGVVKNEEDPTMLYLAFSDVDNEETYLVPISISKIDPYFQLVKQEAAASQIEIATDMPRPPQ